VSLAGELKLPASNEMATIRFGPPPHAGTRLPLPLLARADEVIE
jgi:hypothetical protein